MYPLNSPQPINFHTVFRELLSIHDGLSIDQLIQEDLPQIEEEPKRSYNPLNFMRVELPASEKIKELNTVKTQLFQKKISQWANSLTKHLFSVMYTSALPDLQKVIMRIFSEHKLYYLEEKLKAEGLCSTELQEGIDRLNMMVFYTLNTPHLEKLKIPAGEPPMVIKKFKRKSEREFKFVQHNKKRVIKSKSDSDLILADPLTKPINPHDLQKLLSKQGIQLYCQKIANELSTHHFSREADWHDKLLKGFKELKEEEVIIALGPKLDTLQILNIINGILDDQAQEWKMIYLIGSLDHVVFVEILPALEAGVLHKINEILKRAQPEAIEWFQHSFKRYRQGFTDDCNRIRDDIDFLARRFRDIGGYAITFRELEQIKEMESRILLTWECVTEKLVPLIKGIIRQREATHLFTEDIPQEYKDLLARVQKKNSKEQKPGSLWPIIYRNVFEDADQEDEDEAFNMLTPWGVTAHSEFREAGLLGNITDEQFELLTKPNRRIFTMAYEHLKKLGIVTIADWKRLDILNLTMLKNYLYTPDVREKLTAWAAQSKPS